MRVGTLPRRTWELVEMMETEVESGVRSIRARTFHVDRPSYRLFPLFSRSSNSAQPFITV